MDVVWSWPPVTRTLVIGSFVTSIGVYSGVVPGYPLVFLPYKLFAIPPQLWRLATAFFITRPRTGIIFDPYFLYQYGTQLELNSSRFSEPGAFLTYIAFNGFVIALLAGCYLGSPIFLPALLMSVTYTYAQDNSNKMVTFFIFNIQAKYLPYLLLVWTFVADGPQEAMLQVTGLLAAHLYDFLTRIWPTFGGGSNPIKTPRFVREYFEGGGVRAAPQQRGFGVAYAPPGEARTTGSSWASTRGPGRRLGE
ncbi:hypothetical protein SLS58_005666 [Diplodia intermedia]|uniref:Derlin n=1 Tax=Diplodia intermedia TaxID=856260 RepID=A0ABR3TQ66_9PEZI